MILSLNTLGRKNLRASGEFHSSVKVAISKVVVVTTLLLILLSEFAIKLLSVLLLMRALDLNW